MLSYQQYLFKKISSPYARLQVKLNMPGSEIIIEKDKHKPAMKGSA